MATAKAPTKAQIQAAAKKAKQTGANAAAAHKTKKTATADAAADTAGTAPNLQHLTHIVTQTNSPQGFCYAPADVYTPLVAAGLVDVKPEVVDADGNVATRATAAGIEYVTKAASPFAAGGAADAAAANAAPGAWNPAAPAAPAASVAAAVAPAAAPAVTGFKIVDNVPLPEVKRSFGPKASKYPWDALNVGQSFFIPATEKKPNPSKGMASTVNSAMARYTEQVGVEADGTTPKFEKKRQFALRRIEDGAQWGHTGVAGAAVFRTK